MYILLVALRSNVNILLTLLFLKEQYRNKESVLMSNLFTRTLAGIGFMICAFLVVFTPSSSAYASSDSAKLGRYIEKVCKKNCVDPDLLLMAVKETADEFNIDPITSLAIIRVESNFKPKAVNRTSGRSVGLSQIQVYWHKEKFRTTNFFDIFENVRVGTIIYRDCVDKWRGSRDKALWCYNGHQKRGMATYVPKVHKARNEIRQLRLTFA